MITVTKQAAKQIRLSATQGKSEGMALRIAVTKNPDGSFHYGMGFDDINGKPDDQRLSSEGIDIIVSAANLPLLNNTVIDYVELQRGEHRFIFLNPNDPHYTPPNTPTE